MNRVIWLYRLLFVPVFLLLLPYYLVRMARRGGYLRDFRQRMGLGPRLEPSQGRRIWIQAVSVGEVLAIEPLLEGLGQAGYEIVLTTTTSTGYKLARKQYGEGIRFTGLFPLDFLPLAHNAWNRIRPDICLLMESELWPEHLWQARRRNVPVLLVNARMSDRSYRRAGLASWAYGPLLQCLAGLAASGQQDLERFLQLGMPKANTRLTGNLKVDVEFGPLLDEASKKALLETIGFPPGVPVLLGSSTWPGEEAALVQATRRLLESGVQCRLLLVPRHAERRNEIRKLLEAQELPWHLRSDGQTPATPTPIYVADTTGELRQFTQLASVAFIGKTLPPNEGSQTPIEAAALGVPTLFGPDTSNFRIICKELEQAGASIRIPDADALLPTLQALLKDPARLQNMSNAATRWHQANLGATRRTLDFIDEFTPTRS